MTHTISVSKTAASSAVLRQACAAAAVGACVILASAAPLAAQDVASAATGSTTATQGESLCNADEVMVGITGRYGVWVDQLAARCVRVGVNGNWIGNVRNASGLGPGSGTQTLTLTCPNGRAVVGIIGAYDSFLRRMGLLCKTLGDNARTSGSNLNLAPVGNMAAPATNFDTSCDSQGRPAVGLRLWTGSYVGGQQLLCSHRVPPQPANLTAPVAGASITAFRPQLQWNSVALANRYEVRLWQSNPSTQFPAVPQVTANVTSNSWTPPADLPFTGGGTRVDWEVKACNGNGCTAAKQSHFQFNAPGANYVKGITNTQAMLGGQVHFTVTLDRPVTALTQLRWRLTPDNCYSQSTESTPFQPGAQNQASLSAGQQSVQLSVMVANTVSCKLNGRIETWVRQFASSDPPYFRTHDFLIY